ncbi:MAG TPA: hypothetical protein VFM99_07330 [Chitinophagales bacterium]|nr:hypothetical protein [Chitinophagales bacterium]
MNYNLKALISLSDKFKITVVSPNYRTIENESVLNNLNSLGAISKVQFDNQLYNSVSAITKVPNGFYIADKLNNVIAVGNLESALFASIFLSKIISIPQVKNE